MGGFMGTCAASCPDGGVSLACTGPASCASGQVCCVEVGGGGIRGTSCQSACAPGTLQVCTGNMDCPTGQHCSARLHVCRPDMDGGGMRPEGGGPPPSDAGSPSDASDSGG
jgi:hypothetical protein